MTRAPLPAGPGGSRQSRPQPPFLPVPAARASGSSRRWGEEKLEEVVARAAGRVGTGTPAVPQEARELVRRSRGTAREVLRILERAVAQVARAGDEVAHAGRGSLVGRPAPRRRASPAVH